MHRNRGGGCVAETCPRRPLFLNNEDERPKIAKGRLCFSVARERTLGGRKTATANGYAWPRPSIHNTGPFPVPVTANLARPAVLYFEVLRTLLLDTTKGSSSIGPRLVGPSSYRSPQRVQGTKRKLAVTYTRPVSSSCTSRIAKGHHAVQST